MKNLNQHMQQAVALHQQGQLVKAKSLYKQALRHHPQHPDILNLLGTLYAEQSRYVQSIEHLQKAIQYAPQPEAYIFNLAEVFCRNQQFTEGIAQFKKLLLTPHSTKAGYSLARAYQHIEAYEKACEYYDLTLKTVSNQAEIYYQYAHCLEKLNRLQSAMAIYQAGVLQAPEHVGMHYALARLLFADKQFAQAEQHYLKTLELDPDHLDAHLQLWRLYAAYDQDHKTQVHCQVIANKRPQDRRAIMWAQRLALPIIPQSIAEKKAAVEQLEEALTQEDFDLPDLTPFANYDLFPPYIMAYYGFNDRYLRETFARQIIQTNVIPELAPAGKSRSKKRIGFVVTAGHEGVFMKCMAGMVQQLQNEFEVIVVCMQPHGQNILNSALPQCTYLALPRDLLQAAKTLQAADFDLLYYWEIGTDAHNYFLPFFRTARQQVGSWGWPVTSGIPYINAFISSRFLEPSEGEEHYTEPLLQAQRLLTYYAPPPVPGQVRRKDLGIKTEQRVYLCTQNLRKIQPEMDTLLAGILAEDPRAHIFFIADKFPALHKRLQQRWTDNNLDLERLHILPRMAVDVYLQWVKAADVILDTLCYTGGANTNYDAFQAGTPVVTFEGRLHRERYTSAAYKQMGYTDLITHSPEAYIQQAVKIAQNTDYRHEVSQQIVRHRSALFEDTSAVKACSHLIKQLLRRPQ
jgi:protein O-GlcNAc transferase